jgi:hypothetical protein
MIKIKELRQAQAFNNYRDYVIGKSYKNYFNDVDLIINVKLLESIEYTVKDLKSGIIRTHATLIKRSEVF